MQVMSGFTELRLLSALQRLRFFFVLFQVNSVVLFVIGGAMLFYASATLAAPGYQYPYGQNPYYQTAAVSAAAASMASLPFAFMAFMAFVFGLTSFDALGDGSRALGSEGERRAERSRLVRTVSYPFFLSAVGCFASFPLWTMYNYYSGPGSYLVGFAAGAVLWMVGAILRAISWKMLLRALDPTSRGALPTVALINMLVTQIAGCTAIVAMFAMGPSGMSYGAGALLYAPGIAMIAFGCGLPGEAIFHRELRKSHRQWQERLLPAPLIPGAATHPGFVPGFRPF